MTSNFVRAALASIAFALATAGALAAVGDPIPGVGVGLEGDPEPIVIAEGATNRKGEVDFGILAPGKYVLVVDGKSLAVAIAKLAASNLVLRTGATISVDSGTVLTLEHDKLSLQQDYRPGQDARFAFKITDHDSPRPQDRLFTITVVFPDTSPR